MLRFISEKNLGIQGSQFLCRRGYKELIDRYAVSFSHLLREAVGNSQPPGKKALRVGQGRLGEPKTRVNGEFSAQAIDGPRRRPTGGAAEQHPGPLAQ